STLRDMAMARPATLSEMGRIAGVGQRKLDAYGADFLEVIRTST
ncbi:HRDC domain-containing protein, partial [Sphingomonas sp.]